MSISRFRVALLFGVAVCLQVPSQATAQLVPGTGQKMSQVGDDFEDPKWGYIFNNPKSSYEQNDVRNAPGGRSTNGRFYEGMKRGQPDIVKRVATPAGGIPGSKGALLLQSTHTGIPGRPSHQMQQDDFICSVANRMRGEVPISQSPSCTVRVFLPPVDTWENRTGTSFAFRIALDTTKHEPGGLFGIGGGPTEETYWPGIFIIFESETDRNRKYDTAYLMVRGRRSGHDYKAKQITVTGWWTLGMSCTPDGMVHYYAKPGVEDLTAEDRIASEYPYGYKAETFRNFFFNVCSPDNGRTSSTKWVIDDPSFYISPRTAWRR